MVDYKIVKFCRWCRKRFVVKKGESKKQYCDKCEKLVQKHREEAKDED